MLVSSDVPLKNGAPTLGGLRLTMMVGDER